MRVRTPQLRIRDLATRAKTAWLNCVLPIQRTVRVGPDVNGNLESPKENGARIEVSYQPPTEYRLTVIAEPLDAPDGLVLGLRLGDKRVLATLNGFGATMPLCQLQNVNGAAAAVSK